MITARFLRCLALLFVTVFSASAGWAALLSDINTQGDEVSQFAISFRKAVLEKDTSYLKDILRNAGGYDEEVARFIYDDAYVKRSLGPKSRSVATIFSYDKLSVVYEGAIQTSQKADGGNVYILYFYVPTKSDFPETRIPFLFTHKKWMIDYVACRIEHSGPDWLLLGSFCFNETSGP